MIVATHAQTDPVTSLRPQANAADRNELLEKEQLTLILDSIQDGVTVYDRDGTLVWINKKACTMLGFSRSKLIGRNISDIATLPTVDAIITPELAESSMEEVRLEHRRLEDYRSPGYMVFSNGQRMLYMGTFVEDGAGECEFAIYTLREVTDLDEAATKIAELRRQTSLYRQQLQALHTHALGQDIIYQSATMHEVLERAIKIARLESNVLITGETGVGKNLLARYIHVTSRRDQGPFIHINCASLPESLIEAELFGHAGGAFTGATRKGRRGLIEQGQGGTVFLDEISEMPPEMQAKLLTIIEDKIVRRVGDENWVKLDVRFIAATNRSPQDLRDGEAIRMDLYYRLAMSSLFIPPLRARPEDIPCLAEYILQEFNSMNDSALSLHPDLLEQLQVLPLPGNTRELKAIVWEIAASMNPETEVISPALLPVEIHQTLATPPPATLRTNGSPLEVPGVEPGDGEAQRLNDLCVQYRGDVYAIANVLGVHRTTVIRKFKRYGIHYARRRGRNSGPPLQ